MLTARNSRVSARYNEEMKNNTALKLAAEVLAGGAQLSIMPVIEKGHFLPSTSVLLQKFSLGSYLANCANRTIRDSENASLRLYGKHAVFLAKVEASISSAARPSVRFLIFLFGVSSSCASTQRVDGSVCPQELNQCVMRVGHFVVVAYGCYSHPQADRTIREERSYEIISDQVLIISCMIICHHPQNKFLFLVGPEQLPSGNQTWQWTVRKLQMMFQEKKLTNIIYRGLPFAMFDDTGVCVCVCVNILYGHMQSYVYIYIICIFTVICVYIYIYLFLLNNFQNFQARDTQAKNLGWMFGPTQVVSRFC